MKEPQRKKLVGNGLWESSRMMLPEYVAALKRQAEESKQLVKPILTDDEKDYINGLIRSARASCLPVTLTLLHGEYDREDITGQVDKIETRRGVKILLDELGDDWRWIPFEDIIHAEFDQVEI
ncbi:YolD-like family protein [Paenibacillus agricola]|uniref:YolD-like family protein n=1 Tax=Paenibacillus agricola TaxID=2716264 RepID=A0ABX0JAZ7_9BACL|nr:YolD-like family protein [Paenibacillus agricola]NHN33584.1 YolD-like family protein [Paenibacillus agricola]